MARRFGFRPPGLELYLRMHGLLARDDDGFVPAKGFER